MHLSPDNPDVPPRFYVEPLIDPRQKRENNRWEKLRWLHTITESHRAKLLAGAPLRREKRKQYWADVRARKSNTSKQDGDSDCNQDPKAAEIRKDREKMKRIEAWYRGRIVSRKCLACAVNHANCSLEEIWRFEASQQMPQSDGNGTLCCERCVRKGLKYCLRVVKPGETMAIEDERRLVEEHQVQTKEHQQPEEEEEDSDDEMEKEIAFPRSKGRCTYATIRGLVGYNGLIVYVRHDLDRKVAIEPTELGEQTARYLKGHSTDICGILMPENERSIMALPSWGQYVFEGRETTEYRRQRWLEKCLEDDTLGNLLSEELWVQAKKKEKVLQQCPWAGLRDKPVLENQSLPTRAEYFELWHTEEQVEQRMIMRWLACEKDRGPEWLRLMMARRLQGV